MNGLHAAAGFRAVYNAAGVYEQVLLPHYFDGIEDTDVVACHLRDCYGRADRVRRLNILEFGCGTGRITEVLAPYAADLRGVDNSAPMIAAFRQRFPQAGSECRDTREAVDVLHAQGCAGRFDVVGAFWSLNYPILDLFEDLTVDGVQPHADQVRARADADALVRRILDLVAPRGHLLVLFFDSETLEQQLVTRLWERIAPFPGTGRGYPREIVTEVLMTAERRGEGRLLHTRRGGVAVAPNAQAAHDWFATVHLKSLPALVGDSQVHAEVHAFIAAHQQPSGQVLIPSGVHLFDFWKVERSTHRSERARA